MKANEFKTMIDCLDSETYQVTVYGDSDLWLIGLYRDDMARLDLRHTRSNELRGFKTLNAAQKFLSSCGVYEFNVHEQKSRKTSFG